MLNIEKHKQILRKLLLEIMSEKSLASKLGFKGGTALYFFYELDRFSTDLDFDLTGELDVNDANLLDRIIRQNLKVVDKKTKRFTWFWLGSYGTGEMKIKVEVNTRKYPNKYELKDYQGFSIRMLDHGDMMAHKLCAVLDRKNLQNRDLYDVWWMMKQGWEANPIIVKERMGVGLKKYFEKILVFVRGLPKNYDILQGLGEVMSPRQKDWVRTTLLHKLEIELASRV